MLSGCSDGMLGGLQGRLAGPIPQPIPRALGVDLLGNAGHMGSGAAVCANLPAYEPREGLDVPRSVACHVDDRLGAQHTAYPAHGGGFHNGMRLVGPFRGLVPQRPRPGDAPHGDVSLLGLRPRHRRHRLRYHNALLQYDLERPGDLGSAGQDLRCKHDYQHLHRLGAQPFLAVLLVQPFREGDPLWHDVARFSGDLFRDDVVDLRPRVF
mmetsp:Transcript_742/g.2393  ORF Transcript_742/g.2393 Transcript_742/m.2393 type:complete len:210 (+) Transcript_742:993-1622(+)